MRGSGVLKIVVPHIDIDTIPWRGLLAPQLARRKTHRVDMLRLLAKKVRVGIRKDEGAIIAFNRAGFAPRIARQTRVTKRINVLAAKIDLISPNQLSEAALWLGERP